MRTRVMPKHELAEIVDAFKKDFILAHNPNSYQIRTLNAIQDCRTAALGGHKDICDTCGHVSISYNSCRNRHCPRCQNTNREAWILDRKQDLIPGTYFHVVFTVPESLNPIFLQRPVDMYNLIFHASWKTIEKFSYTNRQSEIGMIAILHTWGQNLSLHPHLHCIVPGGGLHYSGKWNPVKKSRTGKSFLFDVNQLSAVFRGKFMEGLKRAQLLNNDLVNDLYAQNWVVYSKDTFDKPEMIIEYLARYSHKIAISNHRILDISENSVHFKYKDYRDKNRQKEMSLDGVEFLRRFCMHILPKRFVRIRHYGILASSKREVLREIQSMLGVLVPTPVKKVKKTWKQICNEVFGFNPNVCPICHIGHLRRIEDFNASRAPPDSLRITQAVGNNNSTF